MATSVVDQGDEIAAILQVIDNETRAFFRKDFEAWSRCWLQDPCIRRLGWWTRGGVIDRRGWEEVAERTRQQMLDYPTPNASEDDVRRENLVVRTCGDMAWVTYDQYALDRGEPDIDMPGLSRESEILEKHDGEWRLVYLTYVHQTAEPARAPMLRVDDGGRVNWMNQSAETSLKTLQSLKVVQGRLRATGRTDDQHLSAAIREAAHRDDRLDGGRAAIPVVVEDILSEEVCVCWVLTEGAGTGAVLVSVNNLTFAQDKLEAASRVFGLSYAQARLAEMIISGHDLSRSAAQMGITANTAKTHLQRIFDKTGARSQSALVRILLNAAPAI